jgi:MFS family permease
MTFGFLFVAMSAPAPILASLQQEWGFSASGMTLAVGIYAFTQLAALLTVGGLSDHVGRRPVLLGALLVETLSMAAFACAPDLEWLVVARALQGFAAGAATGALSAAIVELTPERHEHRGLLMTSLVPLGGQAAGALLTGLLVTVTAQPSALVFGVFTGISLLAMLVVACTPETSIRKPGALRSLVPRVRVAASARRSLGTALPTLAATWLAAGFYFGVVPSAVPELFGRESGLLSGGIVALLTGVGAVASLGCRHLDARRTAALGAGALTVGLAIDVPAMLVSSLPAFLAGTVVASVGFGTAFSGVIGVVVPSAAEDERSGLYSAVYVASAIAYGGPMIVAGVAIDAFGLLPTAVTFAAITAASGALGAWLLRTRDVAVGCPDRPALPALTPRSELSTPAPSALDPARVAAAPPRPTTTRTAACTATSRAPGSHVRGRVGVSPVPCP